MKKKDTGGKWFWIVLVTVLLFPWPLGVAGDGGSATFGNLIYQVERTHWIVGDLEGYWVQTFIDLFGIRVYQGPGKVVPS